MSDAAAARPDGPARLLTGFSLLWAAAGLFHQLQVYLSYARVADFPPLHHLVTALAALVILRPASTPLFLGFLCAEVALIVQESPDTTNHWFFVGVVGVTILGAAAVVAASGRSLALDRGALYRAMAPPVRVELLLLYFFAVFHKLNVDFLDVDLSCATAHYRQLRAGLSRALPNADWIHHGTIYGTLVMETLIPLLLLSRRHRALGALLGGVWHFVLGAFAHLSFSVIMYAGYALFLELEPAPRGADAARGRLRRRALPPALLAAAVALALTGRPGQYAVFVLYCLGLAVAFGIAVRRSGASRRPARALLVPPHPVLAVFPLLLAFVGLNPYLGLRTDNVFAMYSNLRTEGGRSNHLLVPAWTQLADFQKDLVVIEEASPALVSRGVERGRILTPIQLRSAVSAAAEAGEADLRLSYYALDGARTEIARAEQSELARPLPWLAAKYFKFRLIRLGDQNHCAH